MKILLAASGLFVFLMIFFPNESNAQSEFELTLIHQIDLDLHPLDIATSEDGRYVFIVAAGEILVYSRSKNAIEGRIPIHKEYDRISYSGKNQTLILSSTAGKNVGIHRLEPVYAIDISGLPFKGPADATVTITVFDDYQCPYCKYLEDLLVRILEMYPDQIKIVIKHFPLKAHKYSEQASLAALSAHAQGKFWEFHQKLFENYRDINEEKIQEIAETCVPDMDKFHRDLKSEEILDRIKGNVKNGIDAGVRGTPTVFINGKKLKKIDLPAFAEMIERELVKPQAPRLQP